VPWYHHQFSPNPHVCTAGPPPWCSPARRSPRFLRRREGRRVRPYRSNLARPGERPSRPGVEEIRPPRWPAGERRGDAIGAPRGPRCGAAANGRVQTKAGRSMTIHEHENPLRAARAQAPAVQAGLPHPIRHRAHHRPRRHPERAPWAQARQPVGRASGGRASIASRSAADPLVTSHGAPHAHLRRCFQQASEGVLIAAGQRYP
jgi:hypothetical protein